MQLSRVFGRVYLHALVDVWLLAEPCEELRDLSLAELDVVNDSIVGSVQATQHSVASKILDAVAVLEVLERLGERLGTHRQYFIAGS
jgi:hypothetical protein